MFLSAVSSLPFLFRSKLEQNLYMTAKSLRSFASSYCDFPDWRDLNCYFDILDYNSGGGGFVIYGYAE